MFPILETYRCSKHVEPEEELQGATGECVFERRLSEVAEDILVNAANQAELLKRLQSTADRMVRSVKTGKQNITSHNATQHNTTQHNTTQHNTTQHNTTQHNTT